MDHSYANGSCAGVCGLCIHTRMSMIRARVFCRLCFSIQYVSGVCLCGLCLCVYVNGVCAGVWIVLKSACVYGLGLCECVN